MTDIDEMFQGMAEAQMTGRGNYLDPGVYVVETTAVKYREGYKGKSFIVEFRILESSNAKHAPGTSASWVVKLDNPKTKELAWANLKEFVFAIALGQEPKTVPDPRASAEAKALHEECTKWVKAAISDVHAKAIGQEPGFLNGLPVRLETIKSATGQYTKHNWAPFEPPAKAAA